MLGLKTLSINCLFNSSMIVRRVTWGLICAVAILATGEVSHANLIVNGDFESISPFFALPGTPVTTGGWTFENHGGVVGTGGNPDHFARLESNGSDEWDPTIAQTVSGLTIGESYTLSWDLALMVNFALSGTGRSFGVYLDSQSFGSALKFDEYLSATYKSDAVSFVATSTSHTFIFAGELDERTNGSTRTDVSYKIDNIALNLSSEVPEPSSIVLMGFGLFGIAVVSRKKIRVTRN